MKQLRIDLKELEADKKRNFEERLKFIDQWVEYIKTHSDQEWSRQQKAIIDKNR